MSVIQVSLLLDEVIQWVIQWTLRDMLVRRRVTHSSADEH